MEADAQLERAFQLGFDIRYMDTHMVFPWTVEGLEQALADWCGKKGLVWGCVNSNQYLSFDFANKDLQGDPMEQKIAAMRKAVPGTYLFPLHPLYEKDDAKDMYIVKEGYTADVIAEERLWDRRVFIWQDSSL